MVIQEYLLSLLIFIPVLGSVLITLMPGTKASWYRWLALGIGLLQGVLIIILLTGYSGHAPGAGLSDMKNFQFVERLTWFRLDLGSFGTLSSEYFLGVDGLNITMIVLTVLVMLVSTVASWKITDRRKGYFALLLLLNGAIIGCFSALDFLLFYLFFEFMLLPMFFLIGLWGGPRRDYAAIKFFLYTLLGSILLLIVMIGLYSSVADPAATAVSLGWAPKVQQVDAQLVNRVQESLASNAIAPERIVHTFNLVAMTDPANLIPGSLLDGRMAHAIWGLSFRSWGFLLLLLGFAIKIPVVPLHTWLPDAHVEAPTAISVVLAGVLLKIGAYGLMRTAYLIFPDGAIHFSGLVSILAVISIIYGAMNALSAKDLKRLVAYSSVSHMGFVLLGIASNTTEGVSGALFQLFSHGIISSALFLIAGVLYDRTQDRMISHYSGLASRLPAFTTLTVIFFFASLGLPGMSGFMAEVLVILGAFASEQLNGLVTRSVAIISVSGLVLAAAYYLWTLQRMYFGPFYFRGDHPEKLTDLDRREYSLLLPLAVATILLGIFPSLFLDLVSDGVNSFVSLVNAGVTDKWQMHP